MKRAVFTLLTLLLTSLAPLHAQSPTPQPFIRSPRLGITQISIAEEPTSDERYASALELGAGWNRWPLYWDRVETESGSYVWDAYDRQVAGDLEHGLHINAILLGRPAFYADDASIMGLDEPIFADGTDTPGDDKMLNPDNFWANFVYAAVARYMPDGELAQENDWPLGWGISVWEIWNEPDYEPFWSASVADYARLLKVAYLAAKQADPHTQIMFGGLLYPTQDNWLARVLAIYQDDPFADDHNWYMDMVAVHNYSYPWRSAWLTLYVQQTLSAYDLERPIWLNESGAPVWDDYPGPTWAAELPDRQLRATNQQLAYFFIQSTAYAWAQGADKVFYHQLYDDCGNQPAGTDFPPSDGEICKPGDICFGDAFGLYRNQSSALCFAQHPEPGTSRPVADAFRLMADLFGKGALENPTTAEINELAVVISFEKPDENQRLYVVWSRVLSDVRLKLPAGGESAVLHSLNGSETLTPDSKGVYTLELNGAECDYFPFTRPQDVSGIGGEPLILVAPLHVSVDAQIIVERLEPNLPRRCSFYPGMAQPPAPPTLTPQPTATATAEATETPAPGG